MNKLTKKDDKRYPAVIGEKPVPKADKKKKSSKASAKKTTKG